ncbi:N-acetylmuramoyl-L-alanine amidase [Luteolibacter flavescens]|uniref:N-acetylmuramoyl-L-alanine amidase n=1 Tax=Luteolibacter flavescens TaxID=1859460 RepID=A0ABT3FPV3_9BACT|nr:N-acetylmuramoyl-L-alanine amidase [Luteolibacter flavescens]MCW1885613.1 N-acetylmuramoyl-L-alanine amidase [Luteolibacter flavescens]
MSTKTIIIDPGHGMSNRRSGVFDPGAVAAGVREADIALDWTNELRGILQAAGHKVVRTRRDHADPAPVGKRAGIAKQYGGEVMISFHCNCADGRAHGTETFYRGDGNRAMAAKLNEAVAEVLGTKSRGAKTEAQSQHSSLAVLSFKQCYLVELGFIDNSNDRVKMLDAGLRRKACEALAKILTSS